MKFNITRNQVLFTLIIFLFTLIIAIIACGFGWYSGHKELELQKAKQKLKQTADKLVDAIEETVKNKKGLTLHLSYFPKNERDTISKAAKRNNLKIDLLPVLFAIRKAEYGAKRRELGIIHPRCEIEMDKRPNETLDIQAGWAAATVQKNYDRWIEAGSKGRYIEYLGKKYCPVGASNDPDGLNKNWVSNVTHWADKIRG